MPSTFRIPKAPITGLYGRLLTLYTRANLAYEAGLLGRREEAETGLRDVIDKQLQLSGPQHRNTIISETLLGRLLVQWSRRPAAIPLFEAALAGSRAGLGPSHPTTQDLLLRLADNAYGLGDLDSAELERIGSLAISERDSQRCEDGR